MLVLSILLCLAAATSAIPFHFSAPSYSLPDPVTQAPVTQAPVVDSVETHDPHFIDPATSSRDLFLYNAPALSAEMSDTTPVLPQPKTHLNYVFIKTPDVPAGVQPIVGPVPKQKTLVYVLSKKPKAAEQTVIELEQKPTKPDVFFVGYKEGDNPILQGDIDLQTALGLSASSGDFIGH